MKNARFRPKLNKRPIGTFGGHRIFAVDAFAVRSLARPDEEFTNFATRQEFPNLIPGGEIWLSDKGIDQEGVFFIADALVRLQEQANGATAESAYTSGLNTERWLRKKLTHLKFRAGRKDKRVPQNVYVRHYQTLDDYRNPIEVWVVDGNVVRSLYKTDYTEGGHGYVYRWVPRNQIWIEDALDRREMPFIVCHEYLELRLMRDRSIGYDSAHAICSRMEFDLRLGKGAKPLLAPGTLKLHKQNLSRLTSEQVFQFVLKRYVRK